MYGIEGNIGVGKSTLMKCLSKKYITFEEPIHEWTLLEDFYHDKTNYMFPFQYQVLLSQFNQLKKIKLLKTQVTKPIFMERNPWSSKNIFVELIKDSMTVAEIKCYNKLYNLIDIDITKLFFLNLSPEKCHQRIIQRNRYEERDIKMDYINKLDIQHKKILCDKSCPFKVIMIDVDGNTPEEIMKKIEMYI